MVRLLELAGQNIVWAAVEELNSSCILWIYTEYSRTVFL